MIEPTILELKNTAGEREKQSYAYKYLMILKEHAYDAALAVALAQNNFKSHIFDWTKKDGAAYLYFDDGSLLMVHKEEINGKTGESICMGWMPEIMKMAMREMIANGTRPND